MLRELKFIRVPSPLLNSGWIWKSAHFDMCNGKLRDLWCFGQTTKLSLVLVDRPSDYSRQYTMLETADEDWYYIEVDGEQIEVSRDFWEYLNKEGIWVGWVEVRSYEGFQYPRRTHGRELR